MATREHNEEMFDETYKQKFVEKIRSDVAKKDFKKEGKAIRKAVAAVKERVAKAVMDEMYNDIISVSNELKDYTIKNLNDNDFIFTDWLQESPERGIYGSQEVRRRIEDYLSASETVTHL